MLDRRRRPMDWQPYLDDGSIEPFKGGRKYSPARLQDAWDSAVKARRLYLESCYADAHEECKRSIAIATEALLFFYGYRPTSPATYEFAERLCIPFFDRTLSRELFERSHILDTMLPIPAVPMPGPEGLPIRSCISSSAGFAALVESFIYIPENLLPEVMAEEE